MLLRPSTNICPKDLTRDMRGFFNSLLAGFESSSPALPESEDRSSYRPPRNTDIPRLIRIHTGKAKRSLAGQSLTFDDQASVPEAGRYVQIDHIACGARSTSLFGDKIRQLNRAKILNEASVFHCSLD
jgi:hypothetical protein